LVNYINYGAAKIYRIYNMRVDSGVGGAVKFSEQFYETLDNRFDAELLLGCLMNHNTGNMNVTNSIPWTGFSKLAMRIDKLYIRKVYIGIDEPASEDGAYTQVMCAVTDVDHGPNTMPDLSYDGVFAFGWSRNFYDVINTTDQNKLEVWDGAALRDMNDYLWGAAHGRMVAWNMQSPMVYDYDHLPVTKPLIFYHWTNGLVSAHDQWAMIKIYAKVRFHRRKRWWQLS